VVLGLLSDEILYLVATKDQRTKVRILLSSTDGQVPKLPSSFERADSVSTHSPLLSFLILPWPHSKSYQKQPVFATKLLGSMFPVQLANLKEPV
jgi:hypothetical protein